MEKTYCHSEAWEGLTPEEVSASRTAHGVNRLTPPQKESLWKAFLKKFEDPLIIVLLVVMLLSAGISTFEYFAWDTSASVFLEPLGVLIALLLATGVGFAFEVRAARAFEVLNQVNDDTPVRVMRRRADGTTGITEVARHEVVVGDIVSLETGEEIPADGQLLEAVAMSVNESAFTGEPVTRKEVSPQEEPTGADSGEASSPYAADCLLKGSTVVEGHGLMRVTQVGDATEQGRVYEATQVDDGVRTPLDRQLAHLGRVLSRTAFIVAALIFAGRMLYLFLDGNASNNDEFVEVARYVLSSVMLAVTLIVVSVPEGLPLSITLSLALSMKKMLRENNLVRRLHACETMGAATVICTDKTGTLTQNKMQVAEMRRVGGSAGDTALLAEAIAVNTTAWLETAGATRRALGNPTEGALLLWLADAGIDYLPIRRRVRVTAQEPFSTETKYMTTTVGSEVLGQEVTYMKGAPEVVLRRCAATMTEAERAEAEVWLAGVQRQARRTLAFAYALADSPAAWHLMALAALADPVRPEVPEAIAACRHAGIEVIVVTGDTPGTAIEVGRQIGLVAPATPEATGDGEALPAGAVTTGTEFAAMSDDAISALLPAPRGGGGPLRILARARPLDKQRLVKLLQRHHHVVAVTGDGTNDAPALRAAQVGLSMGDGTAVAKEASDITIIDNSFRSIVRAVLWGRSLYNNIGRFILFQMTVNVAACFIVLVGAFLGRESPLTVTQMLWVNLIMDTFAAMALSSLPADPRVMEARPRSPRAHIIDRRMTATILGWGIALSAGLLWCWLSGLPHRYFFTIFVLLQFWNLFNARFYRTGRSLLGDLTGGAAGRRRIREGRSWGFFFIAALILVGQWIIVEFGGAMFNIPEPLTAAEWIRLLAVTSLVFIVGDLIRWIGAGLARKG